MGIPIDDKTNSKTAGPRGPMLMEDTVYMDEMAHFDRERIPERVVHAKGAGERCAEVFSIFWVFVEVANWASLHKKDLKIYCRVQYNFKYSLRT